MTISEQMMKGGINMETFTKLITIITVTIIVTVLVCLLVGIPTMLLWNWLMPELFGLPVITFWKAVGLNLLAGTLFRSVVHSSN
jgi:hypothetical protein